MAFGPESPWDDSSCSFVESVATFNVLAAELLESVKMVPVTGGGIEDGRVELSICVTL